MVNDHGAHHWGSRPRRCPFLGGTARRMGAPWTRRPRWAHHASAGPQNYWLRPHCLGPWVSRRAAAAGCGKTNLTRCRLHAPALAPSPNPKSQPQAPLCANGQAPLKGSTSPGRVSLWEGSRNTEQISANGPLRAFRSYFDNCYTDLSIRSWHSHVSRSKSIAKFCHFL